MISERELRPFPLDCAAEPWAGGGSRAAQLESSQVQVSIIVLPSGAEWAPFENEVPVVQVPRDSINRGCPGRQQPRWVSAASTPLLLLLPPRIHPACHHEDPLLSAPGLLPSLCSGCPRRALKTGLGWMPREWGLSYIGDWLRLYRKEI